MTAKTACLLGNRILTTVPGLPHHQHSSVWLLSLPEDSAAQSDSSCLPCTAGQHQPDTRATEHMDEAVHIDMLYRGQQETLDTGATLHDSSDFPNITQD